MQRLTVVTGGTIGLTLLVVLLLWLSPSASGPLEVSLRQANDSEADNHSDLTDNTDHDLLVAEIRNTSHDTISAVNIAIPDHLPVHAAVLEAPNRDASLPLTGLLWPADQVATSNRGWNTGRLDPGQHATLYLAVEAAASHQIAVRAAAPGAVPVTVDLTGPVAAPPATRQATESDAATATEDTAPGRDREAADTGDRSIAVNVYSRLLGGDSDDWDTDITVEPGAKVEHLIRFENTGETDLRDVMVGFNLPNYTAALADSTWIINSNNPDGRLLDSDNITTGGINVGHYAPGAVGHVWFAVEVDPVGAFEQCGTYTLRTVGIARPEGMNQHINTTDMDVRVDC